jgi:hypothetical protein
MHCYRWRVCGWNTWRVSDRYEWTVSSEYAVTPGVLFEPLFKRLETSIPQQVRVGKIGYEAFSLSPPDDPLTVTTVDGV